MSSNFTMGLDGLYKIEAVNAKGERRLILDWFKNLILDAGLNRLGSGGAFDRCMVGTSSTPVIPTQTALGAQIATTGAVVDLANGVDIGGGYAWARRTFRFPVGAATGNISEVGVGWSTTDCFSRALTTDTGGSPVTITVLADEFLDVTYELRMHWPTTDVTINGFISGTSHAVVTRAALVGQWSLSTLIENGARVGLTPPGQAFSYGTGPLGGVSIDSGGTPLNSVLMTYAAAYVNNSLQRLYRATFGLGDGSSNINNIVITTPFGIFKSSFSPVIPKTNVNALTLDYRLSWARRIAFSGVNPNIGNIEAFASVETIGSASVESRIELRPDGSVFFIESTLNGSGTHTEKVREWHIPNINNIGAGFEVQFVVTAGSAGGTLLNDAASYQPLSVTRALTLSDSGTSNFMHTRTVTYNIRAAGGGSVLATGTINMAITRING
jgi:hypothetical protein